MHTNKGYIIPVILILLLLLVAGLFIFSQKPIESPVVEQNPVYIATTTPETVSTSEENEIEPLDDVLATTTASTTIDTSPIEEVSE